MTQEQVNTFYNMTILIHEDEWFGKRKHKRDRNEVQEWVAKKLTSCMGIYTTPCGMSWVYYVVKNILMNIGANIVKLKNKI